MDKSQWKWEDSQNPMLTKILLIKMCGLHLSTIVLRENFIALYVYIKKEMTGWKLVRQAVMKVVRIKKKHQQ